MRLRQTIPFSWDVTSLAVTSDGTHLVTASHEGHVVVRSLPDGTIIHTLPQQPAGVWSMAFSPNNRYVAIASDANPFSPDGAVQVLETHQWMPVRTLSTAETGGAYSLAFAVDNTHLVVGHSDGVTRLWNIAEARIRRSFDGDCEVPQVAFAAQGMLLAHACDETVDLVDATTGTTLHHFDGHSDWIHDVAFSPTQPVLAVCATAGAVRLWDFAQGTLATSFLHDIEVRSLAFSADGHLLAAGCDDGRLRIMRLRDGTVLHTLVGHDGWIRDIVYVPHTSLLVSCGTDSTIRIWEG